jgi:hypothetical protein
MTLGKVNHAELYQKFSLAFLYQINEQPDLGTGECVIESPSVVTVGGPVPGISSSGNHRSALSSSPFASQSVYGPCSLCTPYSSLFYLNPTSNISVVATTDRGGCTMTFDQLATGCIYVDHQ